MGFSKALGLTMLSTILATTISSERNIFGIGTVRSLLPTVHPSPLGAAPPDPHPRPQPPADPKEASAHQHPC